MTRQWLELLARDVTALATMAPPSTWSKPTGFRSTVVTPRRAPRRAVRWRRYGGGPVNALHRRCSADIVRGSLRLLDGAAGAPR